MTLAFYRQILALRALRCFRFMLDDENEQELVFYRVRLMDLGYRRVRRGRSASCAPLAAYPKKGDQPWLASTLELSNWITALAIRAFPLRSPSSSPIIYRSSGTRGMTSEVLRSRSRTPLSLSQYQYGRCRARLLSLWIQLTLNSPSVVKLIWM